MVMLDDQKVQREDVFINHPPYEYPVHEADLAAFPNQIWSLADCIDQALPTQETTTIDKIQNYFAGLSKLGIDSPTQILLAHAICTYMQSCLDNQRPWEISFLFAPQYDASKIRYPHQYLSNTQPATYKDHFNTELRRSSYEIARGLIQFVLKRGNLLFISGPMLSAKSTLVLMMYILLKQRGIEVTHIIFKAINEAEFMARDFKLPSNCPPIKEIHKFDLGDLEGFAEALPGAAMPVEVIQIEEATFFAGTEAEAERFRKAIQVIQSKGYSVIAAGLDLNQKRQRLAIADQFLTDGYRLSENFRAVQLSGYCLSPNPAIGFEAPQTDSTARYVVGAGLGGMYDFFSPIFIPREIATLLGIQYVSVPGAAHPMRVLETKSSLLHQKIQDLCNDVLLKRPLEN